MIDSQPRPYNRKPRPNWMFSLSVGLNIIGILGLLIAWWTVSEKQHSDHALKKLYFEFCVNKVQVYRNKDEQGKAEKVCKDIWDASLASNVSPFLFAKVVAVESAFQCDAYSHAGAFGCAQVLVRTWTPHHPDLISQRGNLFAGAAILRGYIDQFGDEGLGLLAYNRGPGPVTAALRAGENPSNGYDRKVLGV